MKEYIVQDSGDVMMVGGKIVCELVRCKDCIYKEEYPSPYWKYWCNRLKCGCDDDWFCADGVRRE